MNEFWNSVAHWLSTLCIGFGSLTLILLLFGINITTALEALCKKLGYLWRRHLAFSKVVKNPLPEELLSESGAAVIRMMIRRKPALYRYYCGKDGDELVVGPRGGMNFNMGCPTCQENKGCMPWDTYVFENGAGVMWNERDARKIIDMEKELQDSVFAFVKVTKAMDRLIEGKYKGPKPTEPMLPTVTIL